MTEDRRTPDVTRGPGSAAGDDVDAAIARAYRDERAAVLATMARHLGDLQLAEDAIHDVFASAVVAWRRSGIPDRPGAWIAVAARRRAIDHLRRSTARAERLGRLAELKRLESLEHELPSEASSIVDDRLRLIFTCCHPALSPSARVALTLRTVGGLTTSQIARAFLVAEPTMGKRIVRAKRKIVDARIPYRIPDEEDLPARVRGVLQVIYLVFNEGYSATASDERARAQLCDEAIRLARLLAELMPEHAEVLGLLALTLLLDARREARVDAGGNYVALPDQSRSRWNTKQIEEGLAVLERAVGMHALGAYQIEATIAALHTREDADDATHWSRVAALYEALLAFNPSPAVAVNHAAAVGRASDACDGVRLLAPLLEDPALASYQPLHATHADLLRQLGEHDGAAQAYERAIDLSESEIEKAELRRRRDQAPPR